MKKLITVLMMCFALSAMAGVACEPKRTSTGKIARSTSEVYKFKRLNACPATGKVQTSCPGYIVDHIIALCKCGPDKVANMQWQTAAAAKLKDKVECK